MSRRKHVLQSLEEAIEPPGAGQHIVRAVGSRGSNIIEVEFPDGRKTLCLLPAKFHKKLWIKKGNYLIVEEEAAPADARVTGQILAVLFADHVKQLKRMPNVWPQEFEAGSRSADASQAAEQLAALGISESDSEEDSAAPGGCSSAGGAAAPGAGAAAISSEAATQGSTDQAAAGATTEPAIEPKGQRHHSNGGYSSSDGDLPPIPKFNNRKIIEYEVSDSDSEDE